MRREADFPGEPTTIGELMRTPQTTPTRDEAVPTGWKLVPVEPTEAMMAIGRTCGTNSANTYAAMLASAPAPASGGVDAVDEWKRIAKEAEARANFLAEIIRDCPEARNVWGQRIADEAADTLASLSPAATPVSEAGGEAAERSWRRTKFEFIGAMRQALINSGLTREQGIIADNAITEAFSDLAKPASSPAGGDVVQTLIDKTEKLIEAADDMGWSCNSSSADQAIREAKDAVRAALSQSTSPEANPTASGETVGSFRDRGPVATNPPGRGGRDQNSTSGEAGE